MIHVKLFLPVIDVVTLRINTIEEKDIVLKQVNGYTKTSGSSAATKRWCKVTLVSGSRFFSLILLLNI